MDPQGVNAAEKEVHTALQVKVNLCPNSYYSKTVVLGKMIPAHSLSNLNRQDRFWVGKKEG